MFRYSTPPGSPALRKLRYVLDDKSSFHVHFPRRLFKSNQESLASMLIGYGLVRNTDKTTKLNCSNTTLVETLFRSICPIENPEFVETSRIIIQSEQTLNSRLGACHASPNCIIIEFSDYNYKLLQEKGWSNSTVLLPVMHQNPSRLTPRGETSELVPLANRSIDVTFFGLITERRKQLLEEKRKFLTQHPNRTVSLKVLLNAEAMAKEYADSKVCLVAHSYRTLSGGEYHRMSEFSPFGCVPVIEEFADFIGVDRYTKCGRVIFAKFTHLFRNVDNVLNSVDTRLYEGPDEFAHVKWWSDGVLWDKLLPALIGKRHSPKLYY